MAAALEARWGTHADTASAAEIDSSGPAVWDLNAWPCTSPADECLLSGHETAFGDFVEAAYDHKWSSTASLAVSIASSDVCAPSDLRSDASDFLA